ncbi:MAG: FMN-binding protein [Spirochaetaceae bacterium]|jgi:major membrane immunogen (membrane-anchored lipoprotein)|nr:FMN-binding protein [Spirochaetaceae bacterium]
MKGPFGTGVSAKAMIFVSALIAALAFTGCAGKTYRDGTWTGRSGEDDTGAWGEVTLTIAGGKVASCDFVTWQKDGSPKDGEYGKINGEISNQVFYDKAQLAVRAMEQYARQYRETGDLKKIDAVSGATIAYNQFLEAVELALEQARQ